MPSKLCAERLDPSPRAGRELPRLRAARGICLEQPVAFYRLPRGASAARGRPSQGLSVPSPMDKRAARARTSAAVALLYSRRRVSDKYQQGTRQGVLSGEC